MNTLERSAHTDMLADLWQAYRDRTYRYILHQVHDCDIADDLLSTVYLKAAVAIANGNGYTNHESGWLWTIVRNVIKDYWRSKHRVTLEPLDDLQEIATNEAPLDALVEQDEVAARVRQAVARLPELQAMVITWRLCGYDNEELVEAFDKSPGAIRAIQVRAFAGLREALAGVA